MIRSEIKRLQCRHKLLHSLLMMFYSTLGLMFLFGCGDSSSNRFDPEGHAVDHRKPLSWGHEHKIYVFADDLVWRYAEQHLRNSLERYYWTTENETYFDIQRVSIEDISHFYRFRNLIFLGHLDNGGEVSQYIDRRLTESALATVRKEGVGLFARDNLWANQQYVVFLLGNNEDNLLRNNIHQADTVFRMFKEKLYSFVAIRVYGPDIYPATYFDAFPWSMKIPGNYVEYKRDDEDNFISYIARRKGDPDRYIAVYHEEIPAEDFNRNWVKETRSRLVWDYYDEDEFSAQDTRFESTEFAGYDGTKMWGRWQNRKYAIGGAFQSFAFYDDINQKAWIIDNSVFYPEGHKLPALLELEVISRTFSVDEVSQ